VNERRHASFSWSHLQAPSPFLFRGCTDDGEVAPLCPLRAGGGLEIPTMSLIQHWLYAIACVVAPVAWGLAMVWVTHRLERRIRGRRKRGGEEAVPTVSPEYHI
jgi:hypothetical protein